MAARRMPRFMGQLMQRDVLARTISDLANPVLLGIPLVLAVVRQGTPAWVEALRWGGLHLLLTNVLPLAMLMLLSRRGWISSVRHARGQERARALLVSLGWLGLAVALWHIVEAPAMLRRLAWVELVLAVLMTAITPSWQISFHGSMVGALIATSLVLYGAGTWPLLSLLPLVGWSQVERGRPPPGQFVAGALLAAILYGLGFGLSAIHIC